MAQANIDYDVQGIRGGEPHHKNNVGNVTVEVDNGFTVSFEAFTQNDGNRERLGETEITIYRGNSFRWRGNATALAEVMEKYGIHY